VKNLLGEVKKLQTLEDEDDIDITAAQIVQEIGRLFRSSSLEGDI
jgi:hypothetical protein